MASDSVAIGIRRSATEVALAFVAMGVSAAVFRLSVVFPIQHFVGPDSLAMTTFRRVGTLSFLALGYWVVRRRQHESHGVPEMRWRLVPALMERGRALH